MIISFLKENFETYLSLLILNLLYLICLILFNIPIIVYIYPTVIFTLGFLVWSFYSYYLKSKKIKELEEIKKSNYYFKSDLIQIKSRDGIISNELLEILKFLDNQIKELKTQLLINNKKIEEDISTWIHQIKIPITAMKLVLDDEDSDSSRQLKSELFRIELYIEMILNYFRLNSSSTDYVFTIVNLKQVIKSEIKRFAPEFIKRKISLELILEDFNYLTDEKWFAFIIDQVISNSLKYTHNYGKIKIILTDSHLIIKDNGIGISSSDIPRIFERGFTGYNGRRNKKASGLGLYLTKKVCDNLNLSVSVDSLVEKGTTILFEFSQENLR